jgi:hypothetical protein
MGESCLSPQSLNVSILLFFKDDLNEIFKNNYISAELPSKKGILTCHLNQLSLL